MGSVILGYLGSMATVLVVLMMLLNDYLQPSAQVVVQPQPLPAIGRVAAAPEPQAAPQQTPVNTRSLSAPAPVDTAALPAAAKDVIVGKEPAAAKEPPPASTDILGNKFTDVTPAIAAEEPATSDKGGKAQKGHTHKVHHHRQYYPTALGFAGGPAYRGGGSFGPWR